ncbi:uncharacterized protein B0H18DRAFT_954132 [Fomitopsis serialis]|uniref:uncharacterized protein n=1 Tax=Fomitopsis serialis TaxID=139415 RepID=UPI0020085324|nr:uncharacterized protein B0H18DRAFT_954132 [Neoantrodia serialis]KAH9928149.1 hypothetical protein B0H18DRAFT_954132 [Neoantrodia serialis]
MYTAEETIAAIKASRSSSPESKKRCNVGDNPPISSTSSSSSRSDGAEANSSRGQTATSTPPFIGTPSSSVENSPSTMDNNGHHHHPHRVDKDVEMFNADADAEAESETTPQMQQPGGRNGLRRVALEHLAQGGRQPEGQADRAAVRAADVDCGERTQPSLRQEPLSSSLVVPIGPLAAAAFENGMSAVEEAAQGSGPGRRASLQRCPSGGLSQKITVPVQGVVMIQLKELTNAMFYYKMMMIHNSTPHIRSCFLWGVVIVALDAAIAKFSRRTDLGATRHAVLFQGSGGGVAAEMSGRCEAVDVYNVLRVCVCSAIDPHLPNLAQVIWQYAASWIDGLPCNRSCLSHPRWWGGFQIHLMVLYYRAGPLSSLGAQCSRNRDTSLICLPTILLRTRLRDLQATATDGISVDVASKVVPTRATGRGGLCRKRSCATAVFASHRNIKNPRAASLGSVPRSEEDRNLSVALVNQCQCHWPTLSDTYLPWYGSPANRSVVINSSDCPRPSALRLAKETSSCNLRRGVQFARANRSAVRYDVLDGKHVSEPQSSDRNVASSMMRNLGIIARTRQGRRMDVQLSHQLPTDMYDLSLAEVRVRVNSTGPSGDANIINVTADSDITLRSVPLIAVVNARVQIAPASNFMGRRRIAIAADLLGGNLLGPSSITNEYVFGPSVLVRINHSDIACDHYVGTWKYRIVLACCFTCLISCVNVTRVPLKPAFSKRRDFKLA